MKEIFKDITGFPGYQISNLGNVKSFKGRNERILKPSLGGRGYLHISIYKNRKCFIKYIHILMAINFLDHIPGGHERVVDHIDNNKLNNKINNLQLISSRENVSKYYLTKKNLYSIYTGVTFHKGNNKFVSFILINGKKIHLGCFEDDYEAHLIYEKALLNIDKFINPKQFRDYLNNL